MPENRPRRVLIVTGRLCEGPIRHLLRDRDADVISMPVDVAALMTSRQVAQGLQGKDLSQYDLILLPGMFRQETSGLAKRVGVPVFLGPVHFVDLPLVLEHLDPHQLSTERPADLVLTQQLKERTERVYSDACTFPDKPPQDAVVIGTGDSRIILSGGCPPRVIGEIVDAPTKSYYSILREAKSMVSSGASVVDIGMIPAEDNVDFIAATLPQIKKEIGVPVSVDTMRANEILSAVDHGADLVLSLCGSTIHLAGSIDVPFVLVPLESADGRAPRTAKDRLALLSTYACRLEGKAFVVDPLLDPIGQGMAESLRAYADLEDAFPAQPSLMGVGNVVEMTDADSVGINALMAGIACENGIQLLLTTENSPKTTGSIAELSMACKMMYYAVLQGVPPKNLGIDLLLLKEKRIIDFPVKLPSLKIKAARANEILPTCQQYPRYQVAIRDERIHLICHLRDKLVDVIGQNAADICAELKNRGWLPSRSHSLYLGIELSKAEVALSTGRNYVQDLPLFSGWGVDEEDQD